MREFDVWPDLRARRDEVPKVPDALSRPPRRPTSRARRVMATRALFRPQATAFRSTALPIPARFFGRASIWRYEREFRLGTLRARSIDRHLMFRFLDVRRYYADPPLRTLVGEVYSLSVAFPMPDFSGA